MLKYLLFFAYMIEYCISQDILGCGGFVKSEVDINYSLIEVKLYTKQGSLKYQTDCAPNNGYYMIPVYDKGDYILQVEPPPGWTFDPSSVELHVDGETDQCSKSEDINFRFTGFGVIGKVSSQGKSTGPAGITLVLRKEGSPDALQEAKSSVGGDFMFNNVLPGQYAVQASHPRWKLSPSESAVTVGQETGDAGNAITVLGYDVQGEVSSDGEAVKGVKFLLFSEFITAKNVFDCDKSTVADYKSSEKEEYLCHATSKSDGTFVFPTLPCGSYKLVPYYQSDATRFDVLPTQTSFTVDDDSLVIKEKFRVAGFSVTGRVLAGERGVSGACLLVNGKELGKTAFDGSYQLDGMTAGTYTIKAQASRLDFDAMELKISPKTPKLPDIKAARFSVCGSVLIEKVPAGLDNLELQRSVKVLKKDGSEVSTIKTNTDGTFCTDLPSADYIFKNTLSDREIRFGLKLAPEKRDVVVSDKPVDGVSFTQFRAKVAGTITCLENCDLMQLSLSAIGRTDEKKQVQATQVPKGTTFMFDDVMPGKYRLSLHHDTWCWKEKTMEIDVMESDKMDITFTQTGFVLSCMLSHDAKLMYERDGKPEAKGQFDLTKGSNKVCLEKSGMYKLRPETCHQFEQEVYHYDTSSPTVVTMTAVRHLVSGRITTAQHSTDITVAIRSSVSEKDAPVVLGPLKSDRQPKKAVKGKKVEEMEPFAYTFSHWARAGEKLEIEPQSKQLLFYPETHSATVQSGSCPGVEVEFEGRQGVFIEGSVSPALSGVEIRIAPKDGSRKALQITTDNSGSYKVGPLHSDSEYEVTAQKEGYVLTPMDGKESHFKALKLGEIKVIVTDEAGQALTGVLLSLSGGTNYRSNNLTKDDGSVHFLGLSPGQYFLRPMMKEFSFEPQSQMIDVQQGSTVDFKIQGQRVAFSCYGEVTSLNGEAEPGVFVEAVGVGNPECTMLQEEAKTDEDGSFRIRGLQPECEYEVRLKTGSANQHIERCSPAAKRLKEIKDDIRGVRILAFRRMTQLDLSGNVITADEYLNTLKVHLYRESDLDSPIHSASLGLTSFFNLPSLSIDHQEYLLRLDSTLSRSTYDYTLSEVMFTANTTYKHFTFKFEPKKKQLDQELAHSSFVALPLTLAVLVLAYNYSKVLPLLTQGLSVVQGLILKQTSTSAPPTQHSSSGMSDISPELLDELTGAKKKNKVRRA